MDSSTFALGLVALVVILLAVLVSQIFATARARASSRSREEVDAVGQELARLVDRVSELARDVDEVRGRLDERGTRDE